MFWNIVLAIIAVLLTVWIIFAVLYYQKLHQLHAGHATVLKLLEQRLNLVPLLVALMTPRVIKPEEVFQKLLELHHELLFHPSLEQEQLLSHQLRFVRQIAEQHLEISQAPRFQAITQEMTHVEKDLAQTIMDYNHTIEQAQQLAQRSRWALFPGAFLHIPLHAIPLQS